jgi:hypothetical protein
MFRCLDKPLKHWYIYICFSVGFFGRTLQGFQYFSSVRVLHYLQVVLFIEISIIFMNTFNIQHSLKSGGIKDDFRQVKVHSTGSY